MSSVGFSFWAGAAILSLALSLSGCALTSKGEALDVRTFSAELPVPASLPNTPRNDAAGARLQLGRIAAASHLRKRIVYRRSAVEMGVYEDRRWAEEPAEYARRAIARALFDDRNVAEALGSDAPVLDVDVLAFEEIRDGAKTSARVTLHYSLHDETRVLAAATVSRDEPAPSTNPDAVARAVAAALLAASGDLADRVTGRLASGS